MLLGQCWLDGYDFMPFSIIWSCAVVSLLKFEGPYSLPTPSLCLFAETLEQKNPPESIGANVEGGYSVVNEGELTFSFYVCG